MQKAYNGDKMTMPNGEDHERIIKMETKINTICAAIQRIESTQDKLFVELKDQRITCDVKSTHDQDVCRTCKMGLDSKIDKKVNWGKFISVIVLVMGIMSASVGWMATTITDNRDRLMILTHTLEDHMEHAQNFYDRFGVENPPKIKDNEVDSN